jgi:hypothetical protein
MGGVATHPRELPCPDESATGIVLRPWRDQDLPQGLTAAVLYPARGPAKDWTCATEDVGRVGREEIQYESGEYPVTQIERQQLAPGTEKAGCRMGGSPPSALGSRDGAQHSNGTRRPSCHPHRAGGGHRDESRGRFAGSGISTSRTALGTRAHNPSAYSDLLRRAGTSATRTQEAAATLAPKRWSERGRGRISASFVRALTDDSFPGVYRLCNTGHSPQAADEYRRGGMVPAFGDVGFTLDVGGHRHGALRSADESLRLAHHQAPRLKPATTICHSNE